MGNSLCAQAMSEFCEWNPPIQTHPFLVLPPEMRAAIWEYMGPGDCRALRQVCELFKWDIEQVLGLSINLDNSGLPNESAQETRNRLGWFQNVIVRKLGMSYLEYRQDLKYEDILLANPNMLRQLVLRLTKEEFGETAKVTQLNRILTSCPSLSTLKLSVQIYTFSREHFSTIFAQIWICLSTKAKLKEFQLHVDGGRFHEDEGYYEGYTLGGRSFQIMPDPAHSPNLILPMRLDHLSLHIPILSRTEFLDWQALLNCQDQLKTATLTLGLVSWDFYRTVLTKSAASLERLDLTVAVPKTRVYSDSDFRLEISDLLITYNGPVFDDGVEHPAAFDWSVLSGSQLEYLRVAPPEFPHHVPSLRSTNFDTLQLNRLREVVFFSVHLSLQDLTRLFIDGVNLTNINISDWTLRQELENEFCMDQNIRIWILIAIVFQERVFRDFTLRGDSLWVIPPFIPEAVIDLVDVEGDEYGDGLGYGEGIIAI